MLFDKLKIRDVTFRVKVWGHHTSFLRNRLTAGPDGT